MFSFSKQGKHFMKLRTAFRQRLLFDRDKTFTLCNIVAVVTTRKPWGNR